MDRLIHYEDLALSIEPDRDGGYRVRTLSSPYGLAAAPFTLPFRRQELETMIQEVGAGLLRGSGAGGTPSGRHLVCLEPQREPRWTFQEIGSHLFHALFHGTIRETYLLSRGRTESLPDRGLRIRIILPTDTEDAALLQSLPWELLYCEQTRDFLARNVLTPVVRQLALPWVSTPFPEATNSQLRILIAVATPGDLPPLDATDERARILDSWYRQERAEVKLLLRTTLRDLYEALRSDHYQVVHFISHGSFDAQAGVGSLLLETPEGEAHPVPGNLLAETLRASRELRLVFLNSCEGAQVGHRTGQDPLLGIAAALVRAGVPAVIGMQFPISDATARIFSEAVYRSLARGSSLDAAAADGRLAIYQADPESWAWVNPALFAALSEPDVLRPLCSATEDPIVRQQEAVARAARLLNTRSYDGAQQVVESCLEQGADLADLHYYRALALLGNRQPRSLKVGEIRPIEASARRVLGRDDCAAHHLCFLAFLQRDFYLQNHLLPPEPGYEELLRQAGSARMEPSKLAELVRLVPGAGAVKDLIERERRGCH